MGSGPPLRLLVEKHENFAKELVRDKIITIAHLRTAIAGTQDATYREKLEELRDMALREIEFIVLKSVLEQSSIRDLLPTIYAYAVCPIPDKAEKNAPGQAAE